MTQLLVDPGMYLDEIQTWVAIHQEIGISKPSLIKLIEDIGFSYKWLHKAAVERDEDEREGFRAWLQETLVPEMIVVVDESSKVRGNTLLFLSYGGKELPMTMGKLNECRKQVGLGEKTVKRNGTRERFA
jgi:hypothetical protein